MLLRSASLSNGLFTKPGPFVSHSLVPNFGVNIFPFNFGIKNFIPKLTVDSTLNPNLPTLILQIFPGLCIRICAFNSDLNLSLMSIVDILTFKKTISNLLS
jgi:hypothetical protein